MEKKVLLLLLLLSHRHMKPTKQIGGLGNAISCQKCRLFRTKANLTPPAMTCPWDPVKIARPALRQGHQAASLVLRRITPPTPQGRLQGSDCTQCEARASLDQFLNRFFINIYKSVTGTWNVFGWNNPTLQENVFTECPGPGWRQQAMITVCSVSLRKWAVLGLGISQSHLLRTKLRTALTQFAGSALDNRVAKHCYHHHKEEVTGVHEMQIY